MTEIEKARLDLKTSVSLLQLERGEHEAYRSERTVSTIEALIDAKLAEHADRFRAIAREEIEAAGAWVCGACGAVPSPTCPHRGVAPQCGVLVRASDFAIPGDPFNQEGGDANSPGRHERPATGLDKSPPAVEAPAAGDPKEMAGRLRNIARDPNNFIPRAGSLIEAAVMIEDTTALARRLAEALVTARSWSRVMIKHADLEQIDEALAEARKHKLIE